MSARKGIVIPCYNEAERMDVKAFVGFASSREDYVLCFVNDGSCDDTQEVLESMRSEQPERIRVLRMDKNSGKGEAVRHGLLYLCAEKDFGSAGFLDADLSTSLDDYDKLNDTLLTADYQAVFGSRIKRMGADIRRSAARHLIGRIFASFIGALTSLPFYDTQCGAKVFKPTFIEEVLSEPFVSRWLFDVEIIMRLKNAHGEALLHRIIEQPLDAWIEMGNSKIKATDSIRLVFDLLRLKKKYG